MTRDVDTQDLIPLAICPVASCLVDPEGHFLSISGAFTDVLGWTHERLVARSFDELFEPDDIASALLEPEPGRIMTRAGSILDAASRWHASEWRETVTADGCRWLVATRIDTALPEREWASGPISGQQIVAASRDCLIVLDPVGRIVQIAGAGGDMLHVPPGQNPIGSNWFDLWTEEERLAAHAALDQSLAGEVGRFRAFGRRWDGTHAWWDVQTSPLGSDVSNPGLVLAVAREITGHHDAELRTKALAADLAFRVKQHQSALAELNEKEEEHRALLDNLNDCVISIDRTGTIRSANPALTRILGYQIDDVVNRHVSMLMTEEDKPRYASFLRRQTAVKEATASSASHPVCAIHKNGTTVPLELSISHYRAHGELFYIGTLRDLSERERLIEDLTRARVEAEQASQAKSAFLAAMSHEIRTPMNGVIGMIEVLTHSPLNDAQVDAVQTIRESAFSLLALIDEVLDFSKIEAGRMELECEPVNLRELAEQVCDNLLPVARGRGAQISMFVDPSLPTFVHTDPIRLRQVLVNLMGNSIKFSPSGGVKQGRVDLRIHALSDMFSVSVSDNGIGMSDDVIAGLFSPFMQGEISTTRRFGGTGLGLAICKRLVDLMGGSIKVESRLSIGSTFMVFLPMAPVHSRDELPQPPRLDGITCVLADGNEDELIDVGDYLRAAGADVIGPVDDLDAFLSESPALRVAIEGISSRSEQGRLLDHARARAGVQSRLILTRGNRRAPRLEAPGVVSLDGNILRRDALILAVAAATGRFDITDPTGILATRSRKKTAPPSVAAARRSGNLILVAEDDEINQKVILRQLEILGYAAEVAGDGEEALRLWQHGTFGLVITDLHMPLMDGYMLARRIRKEEPADKRTPIIALTANALRGEAANAFAAGMDDYLTKPLRLKQLEAALEKHMTNRPDASNMHYESVPAKPGNQTAILDLSVLRGLIGDDDASVQDLLREYYRVAQASIRDMLEMALVRDYPGASAEAHRLKSSSRAMGALLIGDLCAEIENACRLQDPDGLDSCAVRLTDALVRLHAEVPSILTSEPAGQGSAR